MPVTVELQDMFSYSPVAIYVGVGMILVLLALLIVSKVIKKSNKPKVKEVKPQNVSKIKEKYDRLLVNLEKRHSAGEISPRIAHQELSKIIRSFVYEVTGIKVQNYTLEEIGSVDMPKLHELISECYVPEFAVENSGDVTALINKSRKVIAEWN